MHAEHGTMKLIADHAGAEDWRHDPYGTAVNLHFDICEVLDADSTDEGAVALAQWKCSRGAVARQSLESIAFYEGDSGFGAAGLAQALLDGEVTQADLIYAGNVLDRYTDLLTAAGRDY